MEKSKSIASDANGFQSLRKGANSIESELASLADVNCPKCSGTGVSGPHFKKDICSCIPIIKRAEVLGDFRKYYQKSVIDKSEICNEPEEIDHSQNDAVEEKRQSKMLGSSDCEDCFGSGINIWSESGEVNSKICGCVQVPKWGEPDWEAFEGLKKTAEELAKAEIPPLFANKTYKGKSFDEVAPSALKSWLSWACGENPNTTSNFLFLCGGVGNGKTHMASDCVKEYIINTGRPARFLQAEDLVEVKKDADTYGDRKNRDEKRQLQYHRSIVKYAGLLVVDEIGRKRISSWGMDVFEHFVDLRYQSGLPTILISNHTFSQKSSLEGITIDQVVGQRTADRIREFELVELSGPSKRKLREKKKDFYTAPSAQDIESFKFGSSILMKKHGELHMLNWMTRNPVFEPIKDAERKPLKNENGNLVVFNGVPLDADRKTPKLVTDVWQKGDEMLIQGPILGCDDAKTYLVCLDLLTERHRNFQFGLNIEVSTAELLRELGKKHAGPNVISTYKSLFRLSKANISYKDNIGRGWNGPLLTFSYQPSDYGQFYSIAFNPSMIRFYNDFEYTTLHQKLFSAKIGTDGLRMQMFLRSHSSDRFDRLSIDGWLKFLGKKVSNDASPSIIKNERRRYRKKFSELLKKQINAGLLTEDSALKRGSNKVNLCVTPL